MPNPELLSLLLNCLHALANMDIDELQVKAVFELRCACLAGYMPEMDGCWNCGNSAPETFDLSNGRTECISCNIHNSGGIRLPVSTGVLEAMRYICFCDSKRLFSFKVNTNTLKHLSDVTEGYLSTQLERGFSCLDFYKTLCVNLN
jgi:DNA repair protein RecO (recombination protein O)